MQEKHHDVTTQLFQVVLENGTVLCSGVEREFARGFARAWNRLIDRGEPGAYIQPLLLVIRKPPA
jgi:hypothetical protein